MKAWQRQLQQDAHAELQSAWEKEITTRQIRIENETAALIQRIRAGNPSNPKTRRRMRALDRLAGQKAVTVVSTSIIDNDFRGVWFWRVEFSNGEVRKDVRFSKAAAESDVRRVIQDMTGVNQ